MANKFSQEFDKNLLQNHSKNTYKIDFDTIRINENIHITNKSIGIYNYLGRKHLNSDRNEVSIYLTLNFFKQFEQVYMDTKEHIFYLKPYEK
jgi:hypothetical protein